MRIRPVYYLAAFIPVAILLDVAGASSPLVFFAAATAVIPTAALMGDEFCRGDWLRWKG